MTTTLFDRLGGGMAIEGALDLFYNKVMSDPQLSGFFDGVDVSKVKRKQRAFLAMAFGGPSSYDGRDLRAAHRSAVEQGLDDRLFDRFMGHFEQTLKELGAQEPDIKEVMATAYGGKNEVLNR